MTRAYSFSPDELADLLARVALHDAGALRRLYDGTAARLFGVILRIQPDRAAAEDALQETYLAVWQQAQLYRASLGHPWAWLLTLARNKAIDSLRGARPVVSLENTPAAAAATAAGETLSDDEPSDPAVAWAQHDGGEEVWHQRRTQRHLHDCLQQLPPVQRQSVILAYMHGLSHLELAQHLRAPLGSVKSWVRRALLGLRDCLQQVGHPTV
ncbi:ECF RNA polymerase sigma factor SigK [Tepidimonas alkaliphilus]|uniref:ECF RNA polymerase sigma factor SigK n=1 Tax=Tepidimonas alkaliphilus TaxID=2588942 RepID=A0A554WCS9_9BURK|nr:sigma-70 family RNA polymerase sigma factor [Tepidimonas alkaliphilus]TSE21378.1 ECF RNA polymerase sigma factor SigK [Tepidimonas alkaliphilus]